MSGILLPGQDKAPPPDDAGSDGGGIILPKGYERRREEEKVSEPLAAADGDSQQEEAEATSNAATTVDASADAPPSGTSQNQQSRPDFLFPPRGVQIQCPNCNTTYAVPVFTIIDLGANPELKAPLLGGQINVAACTTCGAGGPLNAPLLVHEPAHDFLAVYAPPPEAGGELQQQKGIGELQQMLMRKLPTEARKGYMLQPQQFFDWSRLMEKLWEFEGVAPETLRRQGSQSELMQRLVSLANDDSALKIAVERSQDLIDLQFFGMLEQVASASNAQGQSAAAEQIMLLYEKLLDITDAGQEIKARQDHIRGVLEKLGERPTREDLLAVIVAEWSGEHGQNVVATLAMAAAQLMDYQFLMLLAEHIEQTADEAAVASLNELRDFILQVQEHQKESTQAAMQGVQQLLQEVMQADDPKAALRERAQYLDDTFLGVLAAQAQQAQQQGATAAARRLEQVYQQAVEVLQENMPEDIRLIQQLVAAPDEATARQLMRENQSKLNGEFVNTMQVTEDQMRASGRADLADRIKSLRGQITLML